MERDLVAGDDVSVFHLVCPNAVSGGGSSRRERAGTEQETFQQTVSATVGSCEGTDCWDRRQASLVCHE